MRNYIKEIFICYYYTYNVSKNVEKLELNAVLLEIKIFIISIGLNFRVRAR